MTKKLLIKIKESFSSVLPITAIVMLVHFFVAPMTFETISLFLVGAIFLILGMGLFTLGADTAMMPMGEKMGAQLTKSRNLVLLIAVSFFMGAGGRRRFRCSHGFYREERFMKQKQAFFR